MGRTTGKSLKVHQTTSSNIENSVVRALKHQLAPETPVEVAVKRQNTSEEKNSHDEVDLEDQITAEDLTNDNPSDKYWKKLAEKRRVALQDALNENVSLRKKIDDLKEEMMKYQEMLDEANCFVEVIKEELGYSATDDTGIDVNDISTADETAEADDTAEDNAADKTAEDNAADKTAEDYAADDTADTANETDLDATKEVE